MTTISPVGSAAATAATPMRPSSTPHIIRATRLPPLMAPSPFRSIHQFFVQDVLHLVKPPVEIGGEVMAKDVGDLGVLARHCARRMRADQYVRHVPKRALRRQRLDRGDVER